MSSLALLSLSMKAILCFHHVVLIAASLTNLEDIGVGSNIQTSSLYCGADCHASDKSCQEFCQSFAAFRAEFCVSAMAFFKLAG